MCRGKTKTGAACRAPAGAGGLYYFHANPDNAKVLGQLGGRKNRRSVVDLQVPDNMSAADLRNVTAQAIRLLLSGEMHAREAIALSQLCNTLHRVIPTADLETRVTMLEAQLESETSPDTDSIGAPTDGPEPGQTDVRLEEEEEQQRNRPSLAGTGDSEDEAAGGSNRSGEGEEA
jgi:hypothetical protein